MNFVKVLKNIWVIFLTPILVFVMFLFSLVTLLPLVIHRWCICQAATIFKKNDLHKMVTCAGSIFASEDIHGQYHWTQYVYIEIASPSPNLEALKRLVVKNGVEAKDKAGQLKYPELSQAQKRWMGHLFWAVPDDEFDVNKHVVNLEDLNIRPPVFADRSALQQFILTDLVRNRPWAKGQPLWDFTILPNIHKHILDPNSKNDENFQKQEFGSVIMFRTHHSVGDAISMVKLMSSILEFGHAKLTKPKVMVSGLSPVKLIAKFVEFWTMLKSPFVLVHNNLKMGQRNLTNVPVLGENKDPFKYDIGVVGTSSDSFPLQMIKDLKNFYKVEFLAVALAVVAAGIRKMILAHGGKLDGDAEIDMQFMLPMPGHPDKLRNHMTLGRLLLPIGMQDGLKRLQKIQNRIQSLRQSDLPYAYFLSTKIIGCLPYALKKALRIYLQKVQGPVGHIFTNIPGLDSPIFIDGAKVLSVDAGTNAPIGMANIYAFLLITYNNNARFVTGSAKTLFRDVNDAKEMMDYILEELDILRRNAIV